MRKLDGAAARRAAHLGWTWALREIGAVAAMLAVAMAGLAFLSIAEEVAEGETHAIDRALLMALRHPENPARPIGPDWLVTGAADITAFGSVAGLSLIVLLIAGVFVAFRRFREAAVLVAAPASGVAVSQMLKLAFGRERPEVSLHAVEVVNASFPSGHAMLSAVVYLTLAALVARFTERKRLKAYALAAGVLVSILVGLSRVYLGVHWPTDVLAGWCLGAAWALGWWLAVWLYERLARKPL